MFANPSNEEPLDYLFDLKSVARTLPSYINRHFSCRATWKELIRGGSNRIRRSPFLTMIAEYYTNVKTNTAKVLFANCRFASIVAAHIAGNFDTDQNCLSEDLTCYL
jgi:hypothetical protein